MSVVHLSDYYLPTRKEDPQEAEIPSHRLMIRAGMIRRLSRGIYSYLPLALRVLEKIKTIVREEMNRGGGQEVLLPIMQPRELWEETGRWEVYGPEMLKLQDRHEREYGLGPTHEEVITELVAEEVSSYRDCPILLYQVATKFRDEIRPRFGVMRSREFIMKDAYSFNATEQGAIKSYENMDETYQRIFDRIGLNYEKVEAATGAIGGSRSHEFMVMAETGEDAVLFCEACGYAANQEQAVGTMPKDRTGWNGNERSLEEFETPGIKTIEELVEIDDKATPERQIKTMVMEVEGKPTALLVPGDYDLNETRLEAEANNDVAQMTPGEIEEVFSARPGSLGAVQLDNEEIQVWADPALRGGSDLFTGANRDGYHYRGVSVERDIDVDRWVLLRKVKEGDLCEQCQQPLVEKRGIEVGHIFYLGTRYSEDLGAEIQGEDGALEPLIMGCYGIGISRIMGAAIEQGHDQQGIIWPPAIAPFHLYLLMTDPEDKQQQDAVRKLRGELSQFDLDLVIDDRDESVGYKFNESELIGIPYRVTLGRDLDQGRVEWTERRTGETEVIPLDSVTDQLTGEEWING